MSSPWFRDERFLSATFILEPRQGSSFRFGQASLREREGVNVPEQRGIREVIAKLGVSHASSNPVDDPTGVL
jgi:hypothetical protein